MTLLSSADLTILMGGVRVRTAVALWTTGVLRLLLLLDL
jgi:hypothetical protein